MEKANLAIANPEPPNGDKAINFRHRSCLLIVQMGALQVCTLFDVAKHWAEDVVLGMKFIAWCIWGAFPLKKKIKPLQSPCTTGQWYYHSQEIVQKKTQTYYRDYSQMIWKTELLSSEWQER